MQIDKTHPVSFEGLHRLDSWEQPRMVLAEADDQLRSTLATMFARDGFEVLCLGDGDLVMDLWKRTMEQKALLDVIILDHRLPGYAGLDVLKELRRSSPGLPVIMLTAKDAETRELAYALGATAVFERPVDAEDLRTAALFAVDWSGRRLAALRGSRRTAPRPGWGRRRSLPATPPRA